MSRRREWSESYRAVSSRSYVVAVGKIAGPWWCALVSHTSGREVVCPVPSVWTGYAFAELQAVGAPPSLSWLGHVWTEAGRPAGLDRAAEAALRRAAAGERP